MITPKEINSINEALGRFRKQLDAAKKAAGWGIGDWLFDAFAMRVFVGGTGTPRADMRMAVTSGESLYRYLIQKRNEIIEDPIERHEEALEIWDIANRAARWDRAESINQYRVATDVPSALGKGAKAAVEQAAKAFNLMHLVPLIAAILALLYVLSWLPKRTKRA